MSVTVKMLSIPEVKEVTGYTDEQILAVLRRCSEEYGWDHSLCDAIGPGDRSCWINDIRPVFKELFEKDIYEDGDTNTYNRLRESLGVRQNVEDIRIYEVLVERCKDNMVECFYISMFYTPRDHKCVVCGTNLPQWAATYRLDDRDASGLLFVCTAS